MENSAILNLALNLLSQLVFIIGLGFVYFYDFVRI